LTERHGREVNSVIEGWHDEALLALLQEALRAQRAVPRGFLEAGRTAFAWRDIDLELAQISCDSAGHPERVRGPAAETAALRTLTLRAARLSIELEVGPDCLIGQIIPAQPAVIRVRARAGPDPAIRFDEHGCFFIRPIPRAMFCLHCKTAAHAEVMTRWISL
jgi:hypothetical protein